MSKRTTVCLIPVVLLGAFLAAAWLHADTGQTVSIDRGRAHIEKSCLGCHPGAQLDALVRKSVGDRELAAALDGFLAGHHAADPALRADVLAALARRLSAAEGD